MNCIFCFHSLSLILFNISHLTLYYFIRNRIYWDKIVLIKLVRRNWREKNKHYSYRASPHCIGDLPFRLTASLQTIILDFSLQQEWDNSLFIIWFHSLPPKKEKRNKNSFVSPRAKIYHMKNGWDTPICLGTRWMKTKERKNVPYFNVWTFLKVTTQAALSILAKQSTNWGNNSFVLAF